jgi:N-acetylmuramoyl-L-alanine amidase
MPTDYVVKQGDYLAKIARANGFSDYRAIWDHPRNAELKAERQDPNILFPGDHLVISDREPRSEFCVTEQRHRFRLHTPTLKLRLVLEDMYEKPVAHAPCKLMIGTDLDELTTDANGRISQDLRPDAHDAILVVHSAETPFSDVVLSIQIGDLDPVQKVSGQIARLNNLGYFAGNVDSSTTDQFRSAVEEFQCDHGLTVDGICGPITQSALKRVHGC